MVISNLTLNIGNSTVDDDTVNQVAGNIIVFIFLLVFFSCLFSRLSKCDDTSYDFDAARERAYKRQAVRGQGPYAV
jgi:hypothetical protein